MADVLPAPPPEMRYAAGLSKYIPQPPNWRWERARMLREQGKYARKDREDPWVRLAMKFQTRLCALTSISGHERLAKEMPGLYSAWYMASQPEEGGKNNKWAIEAYLCAHETPPEVAARLNVEPEVVVSFTKLFFDVVGKTRHGVYMLNEVIGRSVHRGLSTREYDLLWKLFGMMGGPGILSQVMTYVCDTNVTTDSPQQVLIRSAQIVKEEMAVKTMIAARTLPVEYNQEIIFNFYAKLQEIEKKAADAGETSNLVLANVNAMMVGCGFQFGGQPDRDSDNQLAAFDQSGAELRAHEQIKLALGEQVETAALKTISFPEAKNVHDKR